MQYSFSKYHFWIRFTRNGWGFLAKDKNRHPLLFSQRSGLQKSFTIGKYYFQILKPISPCN